jgi:hypothetical protein
LRARSCGDTPRRDFKPVEIAKRHWNSASQKRLNNLYAPNCWDTPANLPPFQSSAIIDAQLGGRVVNQFPSESCLSHVASCIGRIVPTSRAILSKDAYRATRYRPVMATGSEEAAFNEALCARVHALRNARNWTSEQMATALGVPPERYRKYEYRSPLPSYLIERFALIVDRDISFILTGKSDVIREKAHELAKKRA